MNNDLLLRIKELEQQFSECQAAIKVKDAALQSISSGRVGQTDIVERLFLVEDAAMEAIAIKPSTEALNAACREYAAKVLEELASFFQEDAAFIINRAKQLRSGEWNPGEVK